MNSIILDESEKKLALKWALKRMGGDFFSVLVLVAFFFYANYRFGGVNGDADAKKFFFIFLGIIGLGVVGTLVISIVNYFRLKSQIDSESLEAYEDVVAFKRYHKNRYIVRCENTKRAISFATSSSRFVNRGDNLRLVKVGRYVVCVGISTNNDEGFC